MPPRKKRTSKTPQKTKSPSPSSTFAQIDPAPEPSPAIKPEPEPELEPEHDIKPKIEPEIEPETSAVSPEEEAPEASESHEVVPPETKTVLRVRKVVKKKIVKKLVRKKLDDATRQDVSEKDLSPNSVKEEALSPNAKEEDFFNPIVKEEALSPNAKGEDFNPNAFQRQDAANAVVDAVVNVGIVKEECDQLDSKDGILKSRKVVRKKIVKKLVPKGSLAANKVDALPVQEKVFDSNSLLDGASQQDATEKAFNSEDSQQQEEKMEEDKKLEDNVEINEECGQIEVKDEILESGKDEVLESGKDEVLESGKDGEGLEAAEVKENEVMGLSERMKRRKSEIFIGGLDRDAKEEDIRSVFGKVGEILELRMMMDGQTGKNKGYAFLRYVEPSQAKRAVVEFAKVEVCSFYLIKTIS